MKKSLQLFLAALLVTVGACGDEALVTDPVVSPTADAGDDQTAFDADNSGDAIVLLDGSGSIGGDFKISTYTWLDTDGSEIVGATTDGGRTLSAGLTVGDHDVLLRVRDEKGYIAYDSVMVRIEGAAVIPELPVVTIAAPANLSEFDAGADITFMGSALDQYDVEVPPEDLEWMSDVDGVLGTGNSLTVNTLSADIHVITLTATDDQDFKGTSSITITVNPMPVSFADDIQPYFVDSGCTSCHGDTNQMGGIRLDSYDEVATGSSGNGPLIVASNSADATAILLPKVEADHNNGDDDAGFAIELALWIDDGADDN